ncbi:MAG: hypothetical protein LBR70_02745 [Lactobacillaceae bacterium]|jgi:hypothetical protein|nr:hypothetical protein [Lactobacillaceae bacterium]
MSGTFSLPAHAVDVNSWHPLRSALTGGDANINITGSFNAETCTGFLCVQNENNTTALTSGSYNIIGNGYTISLGTNSYRRFRFNGSGTSSITGLTIQNAAGGAIPAGLQGGAISNSQTLTITNSIITNNRSRDGGGGIYNSGTLNLYGGTQIINNDTEEYTTSRNGGGIYNDGTVNVDSASGQVDINGNKLDSGNTVNMEGRGAGIYTNGTLNITSNNGNAVNLNSNTTTGISTSSRATAYGGAIYINSGATTITANSGDITIDSNNGGSTSTSTGGASGYGGAIANNGGSLNISSLGGNISLSGNHVDITPDNALSNQNNTQARGGAIYNVANSSTITAGAGTAITIDNNQLNILARPERNAYMLGGAIYNSAALNINANGGTVSLSGNSINGGTGEDTWTEGGAIQNSGTATIAAGNGGSVTIANNTIIGQGDSAGDEEGGTTGGAIHNEGTLNLTTSDTNSAITFSGNTANGVAQDIYNKNGTINVNGSAGSVIIGSGLEGNGTVSKTNNGILELSAANNRFSGVYTQTGGIVKINADGTMLNNGGASNNTISGGEMQVVMTDGGGNWDKAIGSFDSNGALTYLASTAAAVNLDNVGDLMTNATFADDTDLIFDANTNMTEKANYNLNANLAKDKLDRVIFRNSNVILGANNDFNKYGLVNSNLDMRNGSSTDAKTFSDLSVTTSTLSFDANFTDGGSGLALTSDKLVNNTSTSGSNTIALGTVNFNTAGNNDTGEHFEYKTTVLTGLTFENYLGTTYVNTAIYRYKLSTSGADIKLTANAFADEYSLEAMNVKSGDRDFNFAVYGTAASQTYLNGVNLSNAAIGNFNVLGRSGYSDIIDAGEYSLFNLTDATTLTVQDVTLQNASGVDINVATADALVYLKGNVTVADGISGIDAANIYKNDSGTLSLDGDSSGYLGTFTQSAGTTNVASGFFGGASNITGGTVNFSDGSSIASTGIVDLSSGVNANFIQTAGNSVDVDGKFTGAGEINKTAGGTLNLNNDNSGFTGTFAQTLGTTTVNSAFFGGTNSINGGILNFNDGSALASGTGGTVALGAGVINFTQTGGSSFDTDGKITGTGTINKTAGGTLNMTGDNSNFTGIFNQEAGATVASGTLFNTTMNIKNGSIELTNGAHFAANSKLAIASAAELDITNTTSAISIAASNLTGYNGTYGNIDKTGSGNLNLSGDFSGYGGIFTQETGTTILASGSKMFGGNSANNLIKGGTLQVISASDTDLNQTVTLSGGSLEYLSETSDTLTVSSSNLSNVVVSSSGTTIKFGSNSSEKAKYELAESIVKGTGTTIAFEDSDVKIGSNDFKDDTTYSFKDSTIDLTTSGNTPSINQTEFNNLVTDNSSLNIDLVFNRESGSSTEILVDQLVNNGAEQVVELGLIKFYDQYDDGTLGTQSVNVLTGVKFKEAKSVDYYTTLHSYKVSTNDTLDGLDIEFDSHASANSLYIANGDLNEERVFSFTHYNDPETEYIYNIDQDLGTTASGHFTVMGDAAGPDMNTISGKIVDSDGNLTGDRGSFFKLENAGTTLVIQDLTIEDALADGVSDTGNGSVIVSAASDAQTTISNVTLKSNDASGNGGAIYNSDGTITITSATISGNTAGGDGGAVYNNSTLNLTADAGRNITFSGNYADSVDGETGTNNDIYNASNGVINIDGTGTVNIESGISGEGEINKLESGTFNIMADSSSYTGDFNQSAGTTNVTDKFFQGASKIDGGSLVFGADGSLGGGTITVAENTTNNTTGTVNFNSGSSMTGGSISMTDGALTFTSSTLSGGSVAASGGELNWLGTSSKTSAAEINVTDGKVNLGANSELDLNNSSDTISADIEMAGTSTLNNSSGNVTFQTDSIVAGAIINSKNVTFNALSHDYRSGTGTFTQTDSNGVFTLENGSVVIAGSNFNMTDGTLNIGVAPDPDNVFVVANGFTLVDDVVVNIIPDNELNVEGGTANLGSDDTWGGSVNLSSGTLNVDNVASNGQITASGGNLNLVNGSIDVAGDSSVALAATLNLASGTNLNISNDGSVGLSNSDVWKGTVNVGDDGILYLNAFSNSVNDTEDKALVYNGGKIILDNGTNFTNGDNVTFNANPDMDINDNSVFNLAYDESDPSKYAFAGFNSLSMNNGTLNAMNGVVSNYAINELTVANTANFGVDVDGSGQQAEIFSIGTLFGGGNINLSSFQVLSAPTDVTIPFHVFQISDDQSTGVTFTESVGNVKTPIYTYTLTPDETNPGWYILTRNDNSGSINSQARRGQVASNAAYLNQQMLNSILLDHVYLDSNVQPCDIFEPWQFVQSRKGMWVKTYSNSGHFSLGGNLKKVDNDANGLIAGLDMESIYLGSNWQFVPTVFAAYNGGSQKYDDVKLYQKGGQGGFMGTISKRNFITSLMLYAGGYQSDMKVTGHKDTTDNWFAGTAAKAAYNINAGNNFIVQPSLAASYNYYGSQSWNSNFGSIAMKTGSLDGVVVAPGLNLIYGQPHWNVNAGIRYMYNIGGKSEGSAGGVKLPEADIGGGYVEYSLGSTAHVNDNLSFDGKVSYDKGSRVDSLGGQVGVTWRF